MFKDLITVLDFGSSRITALVGVQEVNKSFRLLASAEGEYSGFANGEFVDSNELKDAIDVVIGDIENQLHSKITSLYVGVPAEFCFAYDEILTKVYPKKTKITTKIIDGLFFDDEENNPYSTHTIINKSPLYYIVNDENKTNEPVGMYANKIQARVGYVLVENSFKLLISGILDTLGIKEYDFLSNTLAESIYLIDEYKRNEGSFLIDCGYITTSVSQILGDGLKELKSFSLGGGYITSDLANALDIDIEEAEELKRQAIITLKPLGVDYYEVSSGRKFGVKAVNEIILNRLDKIVFMIKKCIETFSTQLPDYIPICFTGGGINYINGITDYLRKEFDRPIELLSPQALLYRKPDLSSSISLLNMAINIFK